MINSLKKRLGKKLPRVWALRLLQINIAAIYFFSLPLKIVSAPAWLNGDLMYFVLINPSWSRWPWPKLKYNHYLSALLTYASLVTETLFPVLIWFELTRWWILGPIMIFHTVIGAVLNNVAFFTFWTADDIRMLRAKLPLITRNALKREIIRNCY